MIFSKELKSNLTGSSQERPLISLNGSASQVPRKRTYSCWLGHNAKSEDEFESIEHDLKAILGPGSS